MIKAERTPMSADVDVKHGLGDKSDFKLLWACGTVLKKFGFIVCMKSG